MRVDEINEENIDVIHGNTNTIENLKVILYKYNTNSEKDTNDITPDKIIREQFKKEQKIKIVIDFLKCFSVDKLINDDLFDQKEMEKRKKDILKKSFLFKKIEIIVICCLNGKRINKLIRIKVG